MSPGPLDKAGQEVRLWLLEQVQAKGCRLHSVCVAAVQLDVGSRASQQPSVVSSQGTGACFTGGHLMGIDHHPPLVHPDKAGRAVVAAWHSVRQTRVVPCFRTCSWHRGSQGGE